MYCAHARISPARRAGGVTSRRLSLSLLLLAATATIASAQPPRPQVGLALGGGAARGLAHIGLLKWFEEHRIPIDQLAGTSMGGLIGGAYASGLTPDEIHALMNDTDWDLMFLADSPFRYKTFRRKQDARDFPGLIDFGLKGGFRLPSGLNAGQHVELLLDRIALPYYDITDFDQLPTPFRCVAADINRGEPVVLRNGSLSRALRATMAIPAVFTPVTIDDQLLVDGGTMNNVPADVVRAMGAATVIAVNVSSSTDPSAPPTTMFGVLGQTLDSVMTTGTRAALKSADVIVVPDLRGLGGGDWRRVDAFVEQGYAAAENSAKELLKYQVDEASYAEWMRARMARRRNVAAVISAVRVEGVGDGEAASIRATLELQHRNKTIDRAAVEESIHRLSGTDRYEIIDYTLRGRPEAAELVVRVTPKSYGPPFLMPALDMQNIDSNAFAVGLRARLTFYDTFASNSEIRLDAGIGSDQSIGVEFYKLLGRRGFFVAPRAYFTRNSLNGFVDGEFAADYRVKRTGAAIDIGHTTGARSEVRLGYDEADVRARLRIGLPLLPEANGSDRAAVLRWTFDGQNSPMVPSRGVRVRAAFRYYFDTPEIVGADGLVLAHPRDVPQGELAASWFKRVANRTRLVISGGGGTSFSEDPGFNQFRLGGPLRLSSFNNDEIRGHNYLLGVTGLLYEWFRLPDVLGANAYAGGWLEQGTAFDQWSDAPYYASLSAGVILETVFGPMSAGYSQSLTEQGGRFYVAVGPVIR